MPRAHCLNCSRSKQLAAVVRTMVDGTADPARNVLTTCSTSWENCSYMKENFDSERPLLWSLFDGAYCSSVFHQLTEGQSDITQYRP